MSEGERVVSMRSHDSPSLNEPELGVAQTVFLVNRVFVPCQKGPVFDEDGENDEFAFYPLKTMVSLLRPSPTTKMTKMAGVTQEKAWFRESRVCSSLIDQESKNRPGPVQRCF